MEEDTPKMITSSLRTSGEIDKLAAALSKAQAKIRNPEKNKTATVPMKAGGTYRYNYADLADCLDAIRAPFSENGLSLVQPIATPKPGIIEITTRLLHESGQWMDSPLILGLADDRPQTLGAAATYGRRYGACAMAGLSPDEDTDANEQTPMEKKPPQTAQREKQYKPTPREVAAKQSDGDRFDPKSDAHIERLRKALDTLKIEDEDLRDKIAHRMIGRVMVPKEIKAVVAELELPFS
jgi:hypothetical protein